MVPNRLTNLLGGMVVGILFTWGIGFAADTIKLGVAGPHSGDLAAYGIAPLKAAELLVEAVNAKGGVLGKKVELLVEDDLCAPEVAATAAIQLIRKNVDVVLGHICSGATKAALEIYKNSEIIAMSPSATYPALTQSGDYPNFFRTAAPVEAQARVQVDFALGMLKLRRIAVLYDRGDYGKGHAEYVKGFLEKDTRADVVLYEGITPGAVDYSGIVEKIKRNGAEAVIFSGYHPEASKIVIQMRKEEMKTLLISDDGVKEATFIKVAGKYAEGVYVTGPKDVSRNRMAIAANEAYRQVYGTDPGAFYLNAYAAVLALLNAIEKAGSTDYDALKIALHTEYVETPFGEIRFDVNGDAVGVGFSVYQVQKGVFVEIKSPSLHKLTPAGASTLSGSMDNRNLVK